MTVRREGPGRFAVFALLAVMIGCGGGEKGDDPQSRMKRYAPKDAVAAVYLDISAARQGISDAVKKYPKEAGQIKLDTLMPLLKKIDAIVVYGILSGGQYRPVSVIHGEARPDDLADALATMIGAPELAGTKLKPKGNGRYTLAEAPILIVDGREADDLDGNVVVMGMAEILTDALVGSLGKGDCPAVALAIEKADTSAMLWGGMVMDEPPGPSLPTSAVLSANITGDRLLQGEMTFQDLKAAARIEDEAREALQFFGPDVAVKRSAATLSVKSTAGGNLLDMLVPAIRRAVELADQAACKANLKGIGMGCAIYASENRGKFPEGTKVLIDADLITLDALRCPGDTRQRASSYLYLAPSPEAAGRTMILCDLEGNHEGIRNVAFRNGGVVSMSQEEFQAALKEPRNAAFAAALKKAGG